MNLIYAVEMAGMGLMGMGGLAGVAGNPANPLQNLNDYMYQNLMNLLKANPQFLAGGIPTKLFSQIMEPPKLPVYNVGVGHSVIQQPNVLLKEFID